MNTELALPEMNNVIFFPNNGEEIMRLDKEGMVYKGKRIEDAGEAHRAFLEVMNQIRPSRTLETELNQWKACADKLAGAIQEAHKEARYFNENTDILCDHILTPALREYEALKKGGA